MPRILVEVSTSFTSRSTLGRMNTRSYASRLPRRAGLGVRSCTREGVKTRDTHHVPSLRRQNSTPSTRRSRLPGRTSDVVSASREVARGEDGRAPAHLKVIERHHRVDAKQRGPGPGDALGLVIARFDSCQGCDASDSVGYR